MKEKKNSEKEKKVLAKEEPEVKKPFNVKDAITSLKNNDYFVIALEFAVIIALVIALVFIINGQKNNGGGIIGGNQGGILGGGDSGNLDDDNSSGNTSEKNTCPVCGERIRKIRDEFHHIIDKETLMPADRGFLSVSVICKDSGMGDGLSTALFCMDLDEALAFVNSLDGVEAMFVTEDEVKHYSNGFQNYIYTQGGSQSGSNTQKQSYKAYNFNYFDTISTIIGYESTEEEFATTSNEALELLGEYHKLFDIYNEYDGYCINILDTPGHQDFSEDTYRTLMAADSAVMVIDAAKGIEPQTRKLFRVCAARNIPIFTFINKLDREARDPFDLLDELETEFGIGTYPMNWPISCGQTFKGVYDREKKCILTFSTSHGGRERLRAIECDIADREKLDETIGVDLADTLCEQVDLLDGAGNDFDIEQVRCGKLSPVFFGSALNNFGIEPFLESFLKMTTSPLVRQTISGEVDPFNEHFSAFVFKIQANMNKAHRDRIAFMRICSGRFQKGKEYLHVRPGKMIKLSQPQQMMAQEREVVEEAYAGDIIGVFDPGIFSIGDTICEPPLKVQFKGIPTFAPEHFAVIEHLPLLQ